jgi:AcrR family transcriptional regulator
MLRASQNAYHHGQLRTALIQAGFDLLDSQGHEAVTVRGVARLAGVSHAAPVNHFKDRKALLTELASQTFADIDKAIATAVATPQVKSVRAIVDSYEHFAFAAPNRYKLLWRCELLDLSCPRLAQACQSAYLTLEKALATCGVEAHIVTIAASALWSTLHGHVSLRLDGALHDVLPSGETSPTLWDIVRLNPIFA